MGTTPATPHARLLVLVVDDYADARWLYGLHLRQAGHDVAYAATGDEAVARAHELHPDVIVMDLALPGKDGWTATRELKAAPDTAGIAIVAVSGHVLPKLIDDAYAAGCARFLAKPCLPETVLGEVERLGARRDSAPPSGRRASLHG